MCFIIMYKSSKNLLNHIHNVKKHTLKIILQNYVKLEKNVFLFEAMDEPDHVTIFLYSFM